MRLTALDVRGPFRGPTGYDRHVRAFVRALHQQGVAVHLIDFPFWSWVKLPCEQRDPWFDTLSKPVGARTMLHFTMPHQVVPERRRLNVNYTMFEASRIHPSWVEYSRRDDLVIVPTDSSRRAWVDSGAPQERVRVSPLGVDTAAFSGDAEPLPLHLETGEAVSEYRARFLNVSALDPRKNVIGLMRAWLKATSRTDDAVLVIKLGQYAPGHDTLFREAVDRLQDDLHRSLDDAAPIHIAADLLTDADMPRLYAAATHYISMSHGEGWDQPMLEAAASGLRLIAPWHSAYTAYLDESVARLISSHEVPVEWPQGDPTSELFRGASWWEPDGDEAVAAIRAEIDGPGGPAASAREWIRRELTWEKATERLIDVLADLEARMAWRRFWPGHRSYRRG